jgi:hypothetical protein
MKVTNTLAYYDIATFIAVKSFEVQPTRPVFSELSKSVSG